MVTASLPSAYLGMALCFWLEQGSPRACSADLKRHFDGVLLPILPFLNRSCCHLYFDLCIPWSIYARERERGGGEDDDSYDASIPQGMPGEHLAFKACAKDRHKTAAERYKASSVAPKPLPNLLSWVNRHCMYVLYTHTKRYSFNCALALWRGLNGAAHRCGNKKKKNKGKEEGAHGVMAASQSSANKSDQTGAGISTQYAWLSCAFACVCVGWGRPAEGCGRTGTEEQTQLLRKENGLQRLPQIHVSLRRRPHSAPAL